ncbi:MAG: hypothetical protein JWO26_3449 [Rhodospirillales bacterium]|jgi:hypothetical protein|nr:hypothetical protein [Rhodospirillales bacterium]MDB5383817.1 hypothetical protein [Rhodospirillales bacterium]
MDFTTLPPDSALSYGPPAPEVLVADAALNRKSFRLHGAQPTQQNHTS